MARTAETYEQRVEAFYRRVLIDPKTGCWHWKGSKDGKGYAKFTWDGVQQAGHKASWEMRNGPVPEGRRLLHTCNSRDCVNAEHLRLSNNLDAVREMTRGYVPNTIR